MGDRLLVSFRDKDTSGTPAIYLHWGGEVCEQIVRDSLPLLRRDDASYSAARFCGLCCENFEGNIGVGLIPITPYKKNEIEKRTKEDWESFSQGDAGVLVVDMDTGQV